MKRLARALSVIQQGMLGINPSHVKDSVSEASEVLSEMLNTHKCLLESGVEIQKRLESHPASKKMGIIRRLRCAFLGDTPKKLPKGEKRVAPSPPEDRLPKKGKGGISPTYAAATRGQTPKKDGEWQLVEEKKKKKKKKDKKKKEVPVPSAQELKTMGKFARRSSAARSGDAIRVSAKDGEPYADILKAMKAKVNPQNAGAEVLSIRRTRREEILLVLRKGGDISTFEKALDQVVGEKAEINSLVLKRTLEVRDLDETVTREKVVAALCIALGKPDLGDQCRLYKRFGGVQTAVVRLTEADARSLLGLGRLRVGWVNCRIREHVEVARCFRCQGYGHVSRGCTLPARKDACWRCRGASHVAKECKASPRCLTYTDRGEKDVAHASGSGSCPIFRAELRRLRG